MSELMKVVGIVGSKLWKLSYELTQEFQHFDQPDFPFEVAASFHNFLTFTLMFYKLQDFILTRKNHITWAIVQVSSWDAKHECHVRSLYWADGTWDPTLDSTCSVLHEINLTLLSHPPIPHFRLKFLTDQYFWIFKIPL